MSQEYDNIIERIARAIWHDGEQTIVPKDQRIAWEDVGKTTRAEVLSSARAAYAEVLKALEEPTGDEIGMTNMARAGAAEMWQCAVKENTVGLPDAVRIWQAMLRAAPRE